MALDFFWDIKDKIASQLIENGKIQPVILASVWNLPDTKRRTEYMPQKMITEGGASSFLHKDPILGETKLLRTNI